MVFTGLVISSAVSLLVFVADFGTLSPAGPSVVWRRCAGISGGGQATTPGDISPSLEDITIPLSASKPSTKIPQVTTSI